MTAAPSAANISPTTDFPEEMPPVNPTFNNPASSPNISEKPNPRDSVGGNYILHVRENSGTGFPRRNLAARTVFAMSIEIVKGPTPPGTGVIAPADSATSG